MIHIGFFKQFIRNFKNVGAIVPSSKFLATEMINGISADYPSVILEVGAGTGSITNKIIQTMHPKSILIVVEVNADFCTILRTKYSHYKNVLIIEEDIVALKEITRKYNVKSFDTIICSLPFKNFSETQRHNILKELSIYLSSTGGLTLFQYTQSCKKNIEELFQITCVKKVLLNLPPANIFHCNSKQVEIMRNSKEA